MTHHEHWDGTGYPGYIDMDTADVLIAQSDGKPVGKREYEIPLFGRIVSVCDVYDALRSPRIYKREVEHGEDDRGDAKNVGKRIRPRK